MALRSRSFFSRSFGDGAKQACAINVLVNLFVVGGRLLPWVSHLETRR